MIPSLRLAAAVAASLAVGCAGRLDPDASDAGAPPAEKAPSASASTTPTAGPAPTGSPPTVAVGCPITPPADGQPCMPSSGMIGDHFYCHYISADGDCVAEPKCTSGGGSSQSFASWGGTCGMKGGECSAGAPCGSVFERDGACIVACDRVCKCGPDGTLVCTGLSC